MRESKAFSPGHLTGFFQICRDEQSVLKTGSRGAGISLTRGVTTRVRIAPARTQAVEIFFNGMPALNPLVSAHALTLFLAKTGIKESFYIQIFHDIDIPVGCGLGSSGAGALSLVFALNDVFDSPLTFDAAVSVAHQAEVELKTGLGTVMGEAYGGIEIREEAGAPGYGKVSRIDVEPCYQVICVVFGSLSTSLLLSNPSVQERINACGANLVAKIIRERSLENFLLFSREFAFNTGLVNTRITDLITCLAAEEISASMLMFGDGIFIIEKEDKCADVLKRIISYRGQAEILVSHIDFTGVRVL